MKHVLLLSLCVLSAQGAVAAVTLDGKTDGKPSVSVEPPANSPKPQSSRSLSHDLNKPAGAAATSSNQTLRCWQNGKLLFESKNVKQLSPETFERGGMSKLRREEVVERLGDAQPVRVYDFEHGLCIVS